MIFSFLWQIGFNALAIYVADLVLRNFTLQGSWWLYLVAGLLLGIINAIIKPILKLITLPIRILTLGFFNIVINMFLIWLVTQFIQGISINGFWTLFLASIIIGVINSFFSLSEN